MTVSPLEFSAAWGLENLTPSICSLTDGLVARVSNGVGKIRLSDGGSNSRKYQFFMSQTDTTIGVWTGFDGVSVSSVMSGDIKTAMDSNTDLNYYSGFVVGHTTATRNLNCWLADIDLSGSAIWTSLGGTANSGALITPQHWVGVAHWGASAANMGVGAQLKFCGNDGIIYTRTVLSRIYRYGGSDAILCTLDSPLPAEVVPLKIAGNWIIESVDDRPRFMGLGFKVNQAKLVTLAGFDRFKDYVAPAVFETDSYGAASAYGVCRFMYWENHFTQASDAAHWLNGYDAFFADGAGGDSGGMIGGISQGAPFLLSLFSGKEAGVPYYEGRSAVLNAVIAAADSAAGVSTGYTVTAAPDPTA
jgi:hypothetical protein